MPKYIILQLTAAELERIGNSPIPLKLIARRAINDWCELSPEAQAQLIVDRKHHRIDNPTTAKTILADPVVKEFLDSYQITNNSETLSTAIAHYLANNPVLNPPLTIPTALADRLYAQYSEPQAIWDAIEYYCLDNNA